MNGVNEIENSWIAMPDGCRLAALIRLAQETPPSQVPAVMEYIPYRKRDIKAERDSQIHRFFAMHGYVSTQHLLFEISDV